MNEMKNKNIYAGASGQTFFQNMDVDKTLNIHGNVKSKTKKAGIIWILHADYCILPKNCELIIGLGEKIFERKPIAERQIVNTTSGIVKFEESSDRKWLKILSSSLIFKNLTLTKNENTPSILTLVNKGVKQNFDLIINEHTLLKNGQQIAVLNNESYKTQTISFIFQFLNN